jgi:arylsulfatase
MSLTWHRPSSKSPDYGPVGNAFNGEVHGALLSLNDDPNNSDRLVNPEDAIKAAVGRQ